MGMGHPERIPASEFESGERDLMSKTVKYSHTSFSATEIPRDKPPSMCQKWLMNNTWI